MTAENEGQTCKNCGAQILRSSTVVGDGWTHVDGIEFNGYRYCRNAVAEPREVA